MTGIDRLPDFLVLGQEDWDEVERRNQLLLTPLAVRNPGSRFLFAELPTGLRRLRQARLPRPVQVSETIWRLRPVRPLPDRYPRLRTLNDRLEAAQLRHALETLGIERPAFWSQDPRAGRIVDLLPVDRVIYDVTDDWAAFEPPGPRRERIGAEMRALARRADLVLACSRPLEALVHGWGDAVEFLPNGADPPTTPAPEPPTLAGLPRPLIGYAGTIHASRLDVELVRAVAAARPDWSFVFLGPQLLPGDVAAELFTTANVHYLGVRPHREVRSYLEAFDCCVVPHRVTEFTQSLDPLKLYEYLAAGKPIVATPSAVPDQVAAFVVQADGPAAFTAAIEQELEADGPDRVAARVAAVAGETWPARAERLEQLLGLAPATAARPTVSVVVVNYNTASLLQRCLDAVSAQEGVDVEVVVVDNGSRDGSAELTRQRFPAARILELPQNEGFARANNRAFALCTGEFVLLLNTDAFLAPGALGELVAAARRRPHAGAVGPRLHNEDGTLQRSAWPFPSASRSVLEALLLHRPLRRLGLLEDLGGWAHDEERTVDFLIGACLLVRREALAEVGGFDETFWFYGEEADLSRRMARRGWEVVLAPRAVVTHIGGATAAASPDRDRHFFRGQKLFLRKHRPRGAWPVARAALVVGSIVRRRWSRVRTALDPRL